MRELKELEAQKRKDIVEGIQRTGISREEAQRIFEYLEDECYVEVIAPREKDVRLEYVALTGNRRGGYFGNSYKPGNIILNMKKAVNNTILTGSSIVTTLAGITENQPLVAIMGLVTVIASCTSYIKMELNKDLALVLAVLWENKECYNKYISFEEGLRLVNERLKEYDREEITRMEFTDIVEELEEIKCIEIVGDAVVLKEKVRIEY